MSTTLLLVIIVIVLLFGFGGYSYYTTRNSVGHLLVAIAVIVIVLMLLGVIPVRGQEVVAPIAVVPAPTFADQIVPIAVALATAIGIIMAALLPAINGIRNLVKDLKTTQDTQTKVVEKLEVNTNSISEKLRAAIEAGALAKGNLAGRAELTAEQNSAKAIRAGTDMSATPVEIVNPEPVKVTETKK